MSKNKTILISLSNRAVFRNLFFFKNSLYDQLKKYAESNPGVKVVILIPHKDAHKYEAFFGGSNYFVIEPIKTKSPSRFIERVFYFFYSYLIYTGTTKMLATMAIRPDEPPAGGKRYFAPFKWLISRTFGRISYVKTVIVPKLFRAIFSDRPFRDVFDKYNPSLIFATHIYGWFDAHFIREAKERSVYSFGMPAGWDHLDKYFLPFHTDILFAQSDEVMASAQKYQKYKADELKLVGYPHFDFIADPKIAVSRESILENLSLQKDARYVMYISGSAYCPDEPTIIDEILSWFDQNVFGKNMHLVIRPYNGGRSKDREFDHEKFKKFSEHPRVIFWDQDLWGDEQKSALFVNIIRHSDMLLGMYNTVVLEAAVLDVPLLAAAFDGHRRLPLHRSIRRFEQFEHFKDVLATGALPTAYDFEELKKLMRSYVENRQKFAKERELMRKNLCGPIDGKASERLVQELLKKLV